MTPNILCSPMDNITTKMILSDYDGRSPLHIAAAENRREVVQLLLRWNADINTRDNYNNSPLSDALKAGHVELAKLIHSKGGGTVFCEVIFELMEI